MRSAFPWLYAISLTSNLICLNIQIGKGGERQPIHLCFQSLVAPGGQSLLQALEEIDNLPDIEIDSLKKVPDRPIGITGEQVGGTVPEHGEIAVEGIVPLEG